MNEAHRQREDNPAGHCHQQQQLASLEPGPKKELYTRHFLHVFSMLSLKIRKIR
jgi:hypothetical protein